MFSPKCDNFVKLPANSRHLLTTDKFFKTRRCPLFRGFTVEKNLNKSFSVYKNLCLYKSISYTSVQIFRKLYKKLLEILQPFSEAATGGVP